MSFFRNCGVHIEASVKFCPNCGTNLNVMIQDKVFGLSSKNILQKIKKDVDKLETL